MVILVIHLSHWQPHQYEMFLTKVTGDSCIMHLVILEMPGTHNCREPFSASISLIQAKTLLTSHVLLLTTNRLVKLFRFYMHFIHQLIILIHIDSRQQWKCFELMIEIITISYIGIKSYISSNRLDSGCTCLVHILCTPGRWTEVRSIATELLT